MMPTHVSSDVISTAGLTIYHDFEPKSISGTSLLNVGSIGGNGTINGSVVDTTTSVRGSQSMSFTALTQKIIDVSATIPTNTVVGIGYTASVWVKTTNYTSGVELFQLTNFLMNATSTFTIGLSIAPGTNLLFNVPFTNNVWNLLTATVTSTNVSTNKANYTFYFNGVSVTPTTNFGYSGSGTVVTSFGNNYIGNMDEFRYYNRPLSAAEILSLYQNKTTF